MKDTHKIFELKILIAEDDEIAAKLLTLLVNDFSKIILRARNGVEAVALAHSNPDIDLILMDIQMPQLNGDEATFQIRQFNKDVLIIAQTSLTLPADIKRIMKAGCNHYLSKPVDKKELHSILKKTF
jgi:CheY-like chemotaxis protein